MRQVVAVGQRRALLLHHACHLYHKARAVLFAFCTVWLLCVSHRPAPTRQADDHAAYCLNHRVVGPISSHASPSHQTLLLLP